MDAETKSLLESVTVAMPPSDPFRRPPYETALRLLRRAAEITLQTARSAGDVEKSLPVDEVERALAIVTRGLEEQPETRTRFDALEERVEAYAWIRELDWFAVPEPERMAVKLKVQRCISLYTSAATVMREIALLPPAEREILRARFPDIVREAERRHPAAAPIADARRED